MLGSAAVMVPATSQWGGSTREIGVGAKRRVGRRDGAGNG